MSWEEVELSDVCEIGRGSSPRPINNMAYFEGGSIPWIKIADATSSTKVIYKTKQHVNSYGASFSRLLPVDSLIVAASGTLGFPMFLGVEGCIHDGWLYIKNYKGILKEFLYYKIIDLQKYFSSKAYGAAIQNINTDILRQTKIDLPPLETQKKIASILSAYDDLIENNLRRIKLLEEAAQNIYKEWFVNFQFPNHENTKFDEETGLPEGWEKVPFSKAANFINGYAFKPLHHSKIGLPIIKIKELKNGINGDTPRNNGEDIPNKYHFGDNTILFSWSADLNVYWWTDGNALLNQHLFKVEAKADIVKEHFYYGLKESVIEFQNRTTGATMKHIKRSELDTVFYMKPTGSTAETFSNYVKPVLNQLVVLNRQNKTLKGARDILLPRLMNRTIEV